MTFKEWYEDKTYVQYSDNAYRAFRDFVELIWNAAQEASASVEDLKIEYERGDWYIVQGKRTVCKLGCEEDARRVFNALRSIPQQPQGEIADLDSWRRRYGAFLSQNSDCLTELCEIYEALRKNLMQHSPMRRTL